jgi:putative flippase GtrA
MIPDRLRRLAVDRQFLRFLLAGGVNTLFSLGVNVVALLAGLPVWLAMLAGTVAGIAFNFFTLGGYAFRDLSAQRLPRYVLGYAVVYVAALASFHVLQLFVHSPVTCQVLLVIPVALLSYLIMSRFVFQRQGKR